MRIVPAGNGWKWLAKGFALFRKSPAMWLLLVLAYWIAMVLVGQLPYLGTFVSMALLPAFSMSFMAACDALDRGRLPRPVDLLQGFGGRMSTLILLGVLYFLSICTVLAVASVADGGALLRWFVTGNEPPDEAMRDGSVSRAMLLAAVAATPVTMAFWFAPILAAWDRMGAVQALFYSFFAALRNWRAFLVYSVAIGLCGVAFLMLFAVTVIATRGHVETLHLLVTTFALLTLPTVLGSSYASYRDVFPERRVGEGRA